MNQQENIREISRERIIRQIQLIRGGLKNNKMNHNRRDNMDEETLPPSDILFDNMQELKFELLEKTITLEAADYSDCPPEYLPNLKDLLNDYSHRFSKSKLDLEITDLYTADLPTRKGT